MDGNSTIDWVLKNTKFKIEDIVNYGESLGSGVAVELNLKYNFLCTILEAPFTSIADVANKRYKIYPTKYLVKDKFDNLSKIDQIKSPFLIISGLRDEVVPHFHSKLLFNKANNPKKSLFIDEAMHNNLYDFGIEKTSYKLYFKYMEINLTTSYVGFLSLTVFFVAYAVVMGSSVKQTFWIKSLVHVYFFYHS